MHSADDRLRAGVGDHQRREGPVHTWLGVDWFSPRDVKVPWIGRVDG